MFTDTRRIAAKPSQRTLARIDRQIADLYRLHCSGIQINIMDIGKVFDAGRAVALRGGSEGEIAEAIIATVETLRKN